METPEDRRFVYVKSSASYRDFIEFWEQRYNYPDENLYTNNIMGPHTEERLKELFHWKIGSRLFEHTLPSIQKSFISRIGEASVLPADVPPCDFLEIFARGGVIYRIFWLHCWFPDRFPIYDQHVHRAMTYIQEGKPDELAKVPDQKKIDLYLKRYLLFFKPFGETDMPFSVRADGVRGRRADRALWAFGKSLKGMGMLPMSDIPIANS